MLETINSSGPVIWLVLLRIGVGALWVRSGLLKIMKREYLEFDEKLRRFASKNPFPWYKTFLERYLIPNSRPAGYFLEDISPTIVEITFKRKKNKSRKVSLWR